MKAYIQSINGMPRGMSQYTAWLGFKNMGFETVPFETVDDLDACDREDVVVGGLGVVRARLRALSADTSEINYPEELRPFLGRRLWKTTIDHVSTEVSSWPLFVKPVEGKRFTGCVVASTKDLIGKGCCGRTSPSSAARWSTSSRSTGHRWVQEIIDVRRYRGLVKGAGQGGRRAGGCHHASAPAGYAADFGVTSDSGTCS